VGGHESGARVLQNLEPEVLIEQGVVGLQFVKGDVALVLAIAVAVVAVFFEERLNVFAELARRRNFCARRGRKENQSNHSSPKERSRHAAGSQPRPMSYPA